MTEYTVAGADIVVASDATTLIEQTAQLFTDMAVDAIGRSGTFRVALSGGSTPRPLYERLARSPYQAHIDWSKLQVFFSDERFVPATSTESNYHMAHEALFSKVAIPDRSIHRVTTEDISPEQSAALYEEGIRRVFGAALHEIPSFDLILLGMGGDGHTASLFPGTDALTVSDRLVCPNYVPKMNTWRVTFTYPLLNAASCVAFLVQGADKAERVDQVLRGRQDLPAAAVHPNGGRLLWLLDTAAAARLQGDTQARPDGR